jgi:hypothetical protein
MRGLGIIALLTLAAVPAPADEPEIQPPVIQPGAFGSVAADVADITACDSA